MEEVDIIGEAQQAQTVQGADDGLAPEALEYFLALPQKKSLICPTK